MASTFTDLGLELMATGENAGTWGTKTNANLSLAEQLLGGFKIQTLNAAGAGANTTALAIADGALTGAAQNRVIILGAVSPQAITGNKIVTFPLLTETFYFIKNSTSGAYTVQLKAASGSGATVTFSATDKGYKAVYLDGVATNTGVIEIPLAAADGVTLTGTQTLTNKTLTAPKIGTSILDTNGNELALLTATGSAVNEFTLANAASGAGPRLSATGETNVDLDLLAKGTGHVTVRGNTNAGSIQLNCESNSHGQQIKSQPHSASVTNVMLLPAGADSTLVSRVSTDTFTNKTINASQLVDGSIATGKVADDAITLAKMAGGTDGNIISYDTSGNPVAVATGNSGQILTSAGVGAVPSFQNAAGGGKVLQVVTVASAAEQSTNSTSFTSMLSLAITPAATSSKVLVLLSTGSMFADGPSARLSVFRGSTNLGDSSNGVMSTNDSQIKSIQYQVLDSPSTSSAVTYQARLRTTDGSYTMYFNAGTSPGRGGNKQPAPNYGSMTLIEIGA